MKNLISEELLSEVLGDKVKIIKLESEILFNYYNNDIDAEIETNKVFYFSKKLLEYQSINVHELAHDKCKAWALKKGGYTISIDYLWLGATTVRLNKNEVTIIEMTDLECIISPKEYKHIIKLCQWILETTRDINPINS